MFRGRGWPVNVAAAVRRGAQELHDPIGQLRGPTTLTGRAGARLRRWYRERTSGLRLLPAVLVIGAARAGSTSLYAYLLDHPRMAAPSHKEIHYFDLNRHRGIGWYRRHFPFRRSGRITGEASPYYVFHPHVPERVRATLPDVKLIVLVRNPVDRAYSHYHLACRNGREHLSFEEAIEAEPERIDSETERMLGDPSYRSLAHRHHSYLARGRYAEQLERWLSVFPREQLLVLRSEDLFDDPAGTLGGVHSFLELHAHGAGRYEPYNRRPYDELAPATRERLADYFAPHNRRLSDLLGFDLGWD